MKSGLKRKSLLSTGITLVVIVVILAVVSILNINKAYEEAVNQTKIGFDMVIKAAVQTVIGALEANYQEYLDGHVSEATSMEIAKRIVRDSRYGSTLDESDDGYFWADMADGYNVVHYNPNNEGTMRWDAQDQEGTYFIRNFIALGDAGGGFSEFYFGKPGDEGGSYKKRGYTQKFEPYGWYISTGNYYVNIDDKIAETERQKVFSLIVVFGVSALVAIIGLILMSRSLDGIVNPIHLMSERIRRLSLGDLSVGSLSGAKRNDEIGELDASIAKLVTAIDEQTSIMRDVSEGNYTGTIAMRSEDDVMNQGIGQLLDTANNTLSQVRASTEQVASGAKQIADGAQVLAVGSSNQSVAIDHLSSSIKEISEKIKENTAMAERAASLAVAIKQNAEKGSRQMDEMIAAVNEINQAGQNINSVIGLINDISFQTKILSLNAAVEAARAGVHGKGFAVVADEVRNLATRSSEAASNTGELIANSIEKAELGARIADETAASFFDIVSGISESTKIADEISKLSEAQYQGIKQINEGIDQVKQVIMQNNSTAEESAAASEEMSSQSSMLKEMISKFKLRS